MKDLYDMLFAPNTKQYYSITSICCQHLLLHSEFQLGH